MIVVRTCLVLLVAGVLVSASAQVTPLLAPFSSMVSGAVAPPWQIQSIRGRPAASFRVIDVDGTVVEAVASGSVASLIHPVDIGPETMPVLSWRWRILDAVEGSDLYQKSGDDFPARVYVLFDYDLARLPFLARWQLRLVRLVYGDVVPAAALCYVPASGVPRDTIVPNAYTERVRMIVVDDPAMDNNATDKGWRRFERDVVADFKAAFGEPAPRITGVAIAIDSDDTGETARTWFGDLSLSIDPLGSDTH